jgi:hypothetical protein
MPQFDVVGAIDMRRVAPALAQLLRSQRNAIVGHEDYPRLMVAAKFSEAEVERLKAEGWELKRVS